MSRRVYIWLGGAAIVVCALFFLLTISGGRDAPVAVAAATAEPASSAAKVDQAGVVEKAPATLLQKDAPVRSAGQLAHDITACLRSTDADERQRTFLELIATMRAEDAPAIREVFSYYEKMGRRFDSEWGAFWRAWASLIRSEHSRHPPRKNGPLPVTSKGRSSRAGER